MGVLLNVFGLWNHNEAMNVSPYLNPQKKVMLVKVEKLGLQGLVVVGGGESREVGANSRAHPPACGRGLVKETPYPG
jgi:hypothetical protein